MWRWAAASAIGSYHIQSGEKLQDAYAVRLFDGNRMFAVVSDGAGSARFGKYGAWITCRHFEQCFRRWCKNSDESPGDSVLYEWVDEIRDRISTVAEGRSIAPRQFAATVAVLFASSSETIALQIGDCGIVARSGSEWEVICWPEDGEYAATTYFITDDPQPRLNVVRETGRHTAFALFSDGVNDLGLSHRERTVHSRFFEPMMAPVDAAYDCGRLVNLSERLKEYLASSAVCERTHDDKTLVLASDV